MTEETEERSDDQRPSRYPIVAGLALVAVMVVAAINTLEANEGGVLGADETAISGPLPAFAVPELIGGEDADANVFQDDCASSRNPCPEGERRTPACEVELPSVIRVCDFFDRPLVLSFWFETPAECPPTQDAVEDAARRYGERVGFLSIAVRGDRDELAGIAAERDFQIPIGWDRDGAVSTLYRVGLCPTVAFVLPGGILNEALIGSDELAGGRLDQAIERLLRESRRREAATR
jgi:hypothetical protein